MTTFIYAPRITVLARSSFTTPEHMPTAFRGMSTDGERLSEFAGRLCYMSHHNPADRTTEEYLTNIKKQGHGSVLEHANYSLLLEGISRSCTHELVRHRAGMAYSQVSQRYVDESDTAFVVPPALIGTEAEPHWKRERERDVAEYIQHSNFLFAKYAHIADKTHRRKLAREAARSVLPNATETKIVVTANARAWRTVLELRCGEGAEAEIRRLFIEVLNILQEEAWGFFNDFEKFSTADGSLAARPLYHKV